MQNFSPHQLAIIYGQTAQVRVLVVLLLFYILLYFIWQSIQHYSFNILIVFTPSICVVINLVHLLLFYIPLTFIWQNMHHYSFPIVPDLCVVMDYFIR